MYLLNEEGKLDETLSYPKNMGGKDSFQGGLEATTLSHMFRGFINIFSRRGTGFHRWAKLLGLNFSIRKLSSRRLSNQLGKVVLTACRFAWCPALTERALNM